MDLLLVLFNFHATAKCSSVQKDEFWRVQCSCTKCPSDGGTRSVGTTYSLCIWNFWEGWKQGNCYWRTGISEFPLSNLLLFLRNSMIHEESCLLISNSCTCLDEMLLKNDIVIISRNLLYLIVYYQELGVGPSVLVLSVIRDWIRPNDGKLSFLGFVKLLHGVSIRSIGSAK